MDALSEHGAGIPRASAVGVAGWAMGWDGTEALARASGWGLQDGVRRESSGVPTGGMLQAGTLDARWMASGGELQGVRDELGKRIRWMRVTGHSSKHRRVKGPPATRGAG